MVRCSPGLEVDIINYLIPGPHQKYSGLSFPSEEVSITPGPGRWASGGSRRPGQASEKRVRRRALRVEGESISGARVAIRQESNREHQNRASREGRCVCGGGSLDGKVAGVQLQGRCLTNVARVEGAVGWRLSRKKLKLAPQLSERSVSGGHARPTGYRGRHNVSCRGRGWMPGWGNV
jgi:hypothetical protein